MEHLSEFRHYCGELTKYKARESFSKDKEVKAQTYFCRTYSMAPNQNIKNMMNDDDAKKLFYW